MFGTFDDAKAVPVTAETIKICKDLDIDNPQMVTYLGLVFKRQADGWTEDCVQSGKLKPGESPYEPITNEALGANLIKLVESIKTFYRRIAFDILRVFTDPNGSPLPGGSPLQNQMTQVENSVTESLIIATLLSSGLLRELPNKQLMIHSFIVKMMETDVEDIIG